LSSKEKLSLIFLGWLVQEGGFENFKKYASVAMKKLSCFHVFKLTSKHAGKVAIILACLQACGHACNQRSK
jgi:hypothetical protein